MASDVFVVADPDSALFLELSWPRQRRIPEVAIKDEEFSPLLQRVPRLDQGSGGLPCLDDHRGACQRRHRDVPLNKEETVCCWIRRLLVA